MTAFLIVLVVAAALWLVNFILSVAFHADPADAARYATGFVVVASLVVAVVLGAGGLIAWLAGAA